MVGMSSSWLLLLPLVFLRNFKYLISTTSALVILLAVRSAQTAPKVIRPTTPLSGHVRHFNDDEYNITVVIHPFLPHSYIKNNQYDFPGWSTKSTWFPRVVLPTQTSSNTTITYITTKTNFYFYFK